MKEEQVSINDYKDLICDMIQSMNNEKFIKQIYNIVFNEIKSARS